MNEWMSEPMEESVKRSQFFSVFCPTHISWSKSDGWSQPALISMQLISGGKLNFHLIVRYWRKTWLRYSFFTIRQKYLQCRTITVECRGERQPGGYRAPGMIVNYFFSVSSIKQTISYCFLKGQDCFIKKGRLAYCKTFLAFPSFFQSFSLFL